MNTSSESEVEANVTKPAEDKLDFDNDTLRGEER